MGRRDYSAFAYKNSQSVTVKCNKHVTGNMYCKNLFKKIWLLNYQPKMTREGGKLLKPFHPSSTVTVIYFTHNMHCFILCPKYSHSSSILPI